MTLLVRRPLHPVFAERITGSATDSSPAAADSVSRTLQASTSTNDATTTSDAVSCLVLAVRGTTDVVSSSDAATGWRTVVCTAADLVSTSEVPERQGWYARQVAEMEPMAAETASGLLMAYRFASEHTSVADQSVIRQSLIRSATESVPVVAEVPVSYRRIPVFVMAVLPAASGTATRHMILLRVATDRLTAHERVDRRLLLLRSVAQSVPVVSDSPAGSHARLVRGVAISVPSGSATPSRVLLRARRLSEHLTLVEAPARHLALARASTEGVSAAATSAARRLLAMRTVVNPLVAAADTLARSVVAFTPYGPPRVVTASVDRQRLSQGDAVTLNFSFDQAVVAWSVRVDSTGHLSGGQVAGWTGPPVFGASTSVPATALREGANRVDVYGLSLDGWWTP